jgi:hypothetical protein
MLADPSVYTNPQEARDRNLEYQKTKELLTQSITDWEKFSEELHKIEKQFT